LLVGINVPQNASPSNLNYQFIGRPTLLHWEGHDPSIQSAIQSYVIVMGLLFILGILAQVGAFPKEMENTPRNPLDILPLGQLLRRPSRVSKSSWRHNSCQVRVHLGVQEQHAPKTMPRLHNRVQIYTYVWKAKEISIPMAPV
jgi:hypothetical protein